MKKLALLFTDLCPPMDADVKKKYDTFICIPETKRPNMKFNLQFNDVTFRLITIIDLGS